MLKKIGLYLFFFIFCIAADTIAQAVKSDELLSIGQITDEVTRERELVNFIKANFEPMPANELRVAAKKMDAFMARHKVYSRKIFNYFIEAIYQQRLGNISAAIAAIDDAIILAGKNENHYLLYTFFSRLAFVQSGIGSTIEAVSSFRMANKEAMILDDPYLQVAIDINISDIYYKNSLYNQSLFYLNEAQQIVDSIKLTEQRPQNLIYINKAENFFRMKSIDSLKKYHRILHQVKDGTYRIDMYRHRVDYYLDMLLGRHKQAIQRITALQKDTAYVFDNRDRQNLATAYYNAGIIDSASLIINDLLKRPELNNHPEVTVHLYEMLGKIAQHKNDTKQAAANFKLALQQATDQISRLTQMGNISLQIKIDEIQGSYIQKEEAYKRERLWLIFIVVIAVLISGIIIMFYLNGRQKRYYEKLLFDAKREELSFINSHEVRRHLSNILGLIHVLKSSDDKQQTYDEIEKHLLDSSEYLDEAIKNISEKLDNYPPLD